MIFVKICLPLLTNHFYVMTESDRKDGLFIRCRGPIEIVDRLGYAFIASYLEGAWEMSYGGMTYSNTLLNSSPLANSLSFESQIVNSSPSSRGTTSRMC